MLDRQNCKTITTGIKLYILNRVSHSTCSQLGSFRLYKIEQRLNDESSLIIKDNRIDEYKSSKFTVVCSLCLKHGLRSKSFIAYSSFLITNRRSFKIKFSWNCTLYNTIVTPHFPTLLLVILERKMCIFETLTVWAYSVSEYHGPIGAQIAVTYTWSIRPV